MITRTYEQVLAMLEGQVGTAPVSELTIYGVSTDTRKIEAGQLYVPLIGDTFDGHDFVASAVERGAAAVLWQADRGPVPAGVPTIVVANTLVALQQLAASYRQQTAVKVIGVTGSNGKTTTKDMIYAIASKKYNVHKTAGNLNNHIGLPLTILSMDETCEVLILEMGMSGFGEIEQLSQIARPNAAIVTIIGESHLLQLGSRAGIAQAKMEIVAGLEAGAPLIIPGNEPLIESIIDEQQLAEKYDLVRFGEQAACDLYLTGVMVHADFTSFTVNVNDEVYSIPMAGEHNAFNALAAIAIGYWLKIDSETIKWGLKQMVPTGMRMELTKWPNGLTVVNDAYNASPTSMKAALDWLSRLNGYRRKIVVLGDMLELGPDAEALHREVGDAITPKVADAVLTYGPQAKWLADAARANFVTDNVIAFDDQELLVAQLNAITNGQDLVLVKASRGMKMEQVLVRLKQIKGEDTSSWN